MQPTANLEPNHPLKFVLRVTACLSIAGECYLHQARHFVYEETSKSLDIGLFSDTTDSPRWRLKRSRLDGNDLDTITLYTPRHPFIPWTESLFQVKDIEQLQVPGRYLVAFATWCTPAQSSQQLARLQRALTGWVGAQAHFFDHAGASLREALKKTSRKRSTPPSNKDTSIDEPGDLAISDQMLRRRL